MRDLNDVLSSIYDFFHRITLIELILISLIRAIR